MARPRGLRGARVARSRDPRGARVARSRGLRGSRVSNPFLWDWEVMGTGFLI